MNERVQDALKKLRLSGMAGSFAVRVQEAAGNRLSHGEYLKADLLIIDDMGIKQLPKRSGEYLFEIIMRRYETRSTMMTSNRPIEDWGKLIGDVPAATAILDRFLHHAEIITITGRSYRLKDRTAAKPPEKKPKEPRKPKAKEPPCPKPTE